MDLGKMLAEALCGSFPFEGGGVISLERFATAEQLAAAAEAFLAKVREVTPAMRTAGDDYLSANTSEYDPHRPDVADKVFQTMLDAAIGKVAAGHTGPVPFYGDA